MGKYFNNIYVVMTIVGEVLGIISLILGIVHGIFSDAKFALLLCVLLLLLLSFRIVTIANKDNKIIKANKELAVISKGHVSLMIGICAFYSAFSYIQGTSFLTLIAIIAIIVVFMAIMLFALLKMIKRITQLVKESEQDRT